MTSPDTAGGATAAPSAPAWLAPLAAGLEAAPFGVAVLDADSRYWWVNAAMATIDRRPAADHPGSTAFELFGHAVDVWTPHVATVARTGLAVGPVRIDGTIGAPRRRRAYDASYHPIVDPTAPGEVVAVMAVVQDVTAVAEGQRWSTVVARITRALAAAGTAAEVAESLGRELHGAFADRVTVATVAGDEVRVATLVGFPATVHERWSGLVLDLDDANPISAAARTAEPVQVADTGELEQRFPSFAGRDPGVIGAAMTSVPVLTGSGRVAAVVHVAWETADRAVPAALDVLLTVAAIAGTALGRIELGEALQQDRFQRVLDAMLDDVALAVAVRDDEGRIVDFRLTYVNDRTVDGAGRRSAEMTGSSVLEMYPQWRASGLFDRFRRVVETGVPYVEDALHYVDEVDGVPIEGWWRVAAVRLGDGYLATSRDVSDDVRAARELAEARARLTAERDAVRLLQDMALPRRLPSAPGVSLAAHYRPADPEVPIGGDWYDAFELPDGRVGLVVGDVAGHGRTAATSMVRHRTALATLALLQPSPAAVLARAHAAALADGDTFTTCCYAVVDPVAGTLTMARAGHPPPLLLTGGTAGPLHVPGGVPLGVDAPLAYTDRVITLDGPCALVLYTDGLVERRDEEIFVSVERLAAGVADADPADADALLARLVATVGDGPAADDFCVLVAAIDPRRPTVS